MPPSLRRRPQVPPAPHFPAEPVSDTDEAAEAEGIMEEDVEEDVVADEDVGVDVEDEGDEDEEEPLASPTPSIHAPIPPNFREISTLASWTVSSSKPGCSIPQLRSPSTNLFWQSDGPQPHYLNIHFFKLVRIVGLRLFLDFDADESYTPTKIIFLAGSGNNDLVEWGEMRLEQPRGWIWADFSGVGEVESGSEDDDDDNSEEDDIVPAAVAEELHDDNGSDFENTQPANGTGAVAAGGGGTNTMNLDVQNQHTPIPHLLPQSTPTAPNQSIPRVHPRRPFTNLTPNASPHLPPPTKAKKQKMPVLRAHLVQIKILENHQNGKDTHLRGLQIFAKDTEREKVSRPGVRKSAVGLGIADTGRPGMNSNGVGSGMRGLSKSPWDVEPSIR